MSKDPAILFYTADFLIGTSLMSNEQVGMYIRLLCYQHQKGRLTKKEIETICGTFDEEIMSKFIKDENNHYYNDRLEEESVKRSKYAESRRSNRLKSEKKETYVKDMNNICQTYERHMENENENENEVVIIKQKKAQNTIPPTPEMVTEYCIGRNNQIDPQQFFDFYETKGWKVGKEKMKDWQACIRTWEKRETKKGGNSFIGILSEYED